jgi:pilus assembly protein FimV
MFRDQLSRPRRRGRAGAWQCWWIAAAAAVLAAAPNAWALGLGDIDLDSALNEKFSARIELIDVQGLQPSEIIVSLASAEDFARVGVERFFFLTDLRFEVADGGRGVTHITVTSTQPVTEPYLNFLVEVLWPSGRMLKEYTVLLDPPTFSPAAAPAVSAPSVARTDERSAGPVERSRPAAVESGTQVRLGNTARGPSPLDEGVVDGEYRMTDRNDTLWRIASSTRPSDRVSVKQNMLAIQRLNPEAFLNGNINLLKAGYSLRLPSESEALAIDDNDANQQVAMQNEDWRALQRGERVPDRATAEQVAAAEQAPESSLRSQVDATPARPAGTPGEARTEGELRIVAGSGDGISSGADSDITLQAALEEQDRLGRELEQLTEALDREKELASNQIAVKDRQIEVRDQQIAEMQAELERLREEAAQAAAGQSQNQNASAADQPWWQSPYVLFGTAGIVVLLLVYGMVTVRRRRAAEADELYVDDDEPARRPVTPAVSALAAAGAAQAPAQVRRAEQGMDDLAEELEAADIGTASAAASAAVPREDGAETGDVIGEADIYIAYGRYPQAIGLLLGVLEDDPNRNDVRLKLLELYSETRDRQAFDTHMAELVARCDDQEALLTARELAAQFADGDMGEPAEEAEDALALDLEDQHPAAEGDGVLDAAGEFELELDEVTDDRPARTASDDLGGDLGIDFDPDRDGEAGSGDDLDLELGDAEALDGDLSEEGFEFDDQGDTAGTKLDLARAYLDMGDQDGARDILNEVVAEGNAEQQKRAQAMLEEL